MANYTGFAMPPTEPLLRARPSLKSFAGLYLVLGVLCILVWVAGATLDTGVSPLLIALAGPVLMALGIAEMGTAEAPGRRCTGAQGLKHRRRARAGDPDHRDPGAAGRCRAGKNRVGGRRLDQRMGSQIDAEETG